MKSQRNVTYHKNKKIKKKHNRHQHNTKMTNDGGQAIGELSIATAIPKQPDLIDFLHLV